MDDQNSIALPSVQISYRVFLRDMLPGWVLILGLVYVVVPAAFGQDQSIFVYAAIALTALVWSPVVGLMVNALGYMALEWIVTNKRIDALYALVFRNNTKTKKEYLLRIIKLAFGSGVSSGEETAQKEEVLGEEGKFVEARVGYLLRVSGFHGRDDLSERIHAVNQSARSMAFLSALAAISIAISKLEARGLDLSLSRTPLSTLDTRPFIFLAIVFLIICCFAMRYAKYLDIRLLHELIVMNTVPLSAVRGDAPSSNVSNSGRAS